MDRPADLLEFGIDVARRAGQASLAHFRAGVVAESKPDLSPVTIADREAERLAREHIEQRFPADGILGEELGEVRAGARRRWIIDPIDGTRSFVRGVPLFGTLIALEEAGDPLLGIIHLPALNETVWAARGEGCWWDGKRAHVSETVSLEQALVLTSDAENIERQGYLPGWRRLAARAGICRTWGDCYGYALVATGRAEAMLDPVLAVWDAAAVVPIIQEAGGVVTDWSGRRGHQHGSLVATSAVLASEIRDLLKEGQ